MEFINVAQTSDIPPGSMKEVICRDHVILIVNIADLYYAVSNHYTHRGGRLSEGLLRGEILTCPKHGAQFNVKTGEAVGKAKFMFIKTKVKNVLSYPVKIIGEDILIGID